LIDLDIAVASKGWKALGDAEAVEALARRAVEAALAVIGRPPEELSLSLLLADDRAVRALNRGFRGKDKPTNVLSFPASAPPGLPGPRPLGDIALAFETVAREAESEGKTLADHARHLIVHGTLHLLGYDHETDAEAERMEALEVEALARLGIADPYREAAA
jgi:probable rRNA maturation factor